MIKLLKSKVPINFSCRYFGVSRSSFYYWLKDKTLESLATKEVIFREIKAIFEVSKGTYGSPRVYKELVSRGLKVSENSVARYMQEIGLDGRHKKKFKVQTTDSNHDSPIAPRVFKVEDKPLPKKPGEVLAGDITFNYNSLRSRNFFSKKIFKNKFFSPRKTILLFSKSKS